MQLINKIYIENVKNRLFEIKFFLEYVILKQREYFNMATKLGRLTCLYMTKYPLVSRYVCRSESLTDVSRQETGRTPLYEVKFK